MDRHVVVSSSELGRVHVEIELRFCFRTFRGTVYPLYEISCNFPEPKTSSREGNMFGLGNASGTISPVCIQPMSEISSHAYGGQISVLPSMRLFSVVKAQVRITTVKITKESVTATTGMVRLDALLYPLLVRVRCPLPQPGRRVPSPKRSSPRVVT